MAEQLLLVGVIFLIATVTSVLLVLKLQSRQHAYGHQMAWENEQKRVQQMWEIRQEKHMLELENTLVAHVQGLEASWRAWEGKDTLLVKNTLEHYEAMLAQIRLERQLARIPHSEEVPLSPP